VAFILLILLLQSHVLSLSPYTHPRDLASTRGCCTSPGCHSHPRVVRHAFIHRPSEWGHSHHHQGLVRRLYQETQVASQGPWCKHASCQGMNQLIVTWIRASRLTFTQLRQVLCIASDQAVVFERYSDSAGGYVVLDDANPAVFKTLIRAAKAKLKLKLRASAPSEETKIDAPSEESSVVPEAPIAPSRSATTLDQHSIGPGIFEFRDALSSMKTDVEAPVPRPFGKFDDMSMRSTRT